MRFKPLILLIIIIFLLSLSGCSARNVPDSPTAAQVGNNIISLKDVQTFKKLKGDKLTDKQIIDMLVEKNILFQEAEKAGMAVSFQDAKEYAKEQRRIIETTTEGQSKKAVSDLIKKLEITYKDYWDEYAPKGYMRALSEEKMKRKIIDEISDGIQKDSPNLDGDKFKKASEEKYNKRMQELIIKYNVKYYFGNQPQG